MESGRRAVTAPIAMRADADTPQLSVSCSRSADGTLTIRLAGPWRLEGGIDRAIAIVRRELQQSPRVTHIAFETSHLGHWDSALPTFVATIEELSSEQKIPADRSGLPDGATRLLELADTNVEQVATRAARSPGPVTHAGEAAIGAYTTFLAAINFVGDVTLAFGQMLRGRARYRGIDVFTLMRECGADALGIVALISFLVGTILAFMGAVQLQQFGASIYVADLVAIGITREMAPMMTAVIMAGRTGAAFAAQIGTMRVRQEVEALETMGISPIEFLVLPRMVALVLMMPLLCLYSDFIGVMGGASIGVGMLRLTFKTYLLESRHAIWPPGVFGGLFKSLVYGILIALAGCYQGIKCGSSAAAVGEATTAAVVNGIILVVAACGLLAFVYHVIGI